MRWGDVSMRIPRSWQVRTAPEAGVLAATRPGTVPPSGVSPELVLRAAPAEGDLASWRAAAHVDLASQLTGFALEDEDVFDVNGREVHYSRFGHRYGVVDVVCDQWSWLVDGVGVTLTGLVAREDYATWCDVFDAVAETVEIVPPAA